MDELLNNAPCGFLVVTDAGEIVEANETLLNLVGYKLIELKSLHIEKIFSIAGRIFYQTHVFPLLKLHGKVEEIYLTLRAKNGEEIPVLVNGSRHEREGTVFNDCVFVAMRQRNEYENEILRAKKEAEAATRAKDEFLSVVSHELRTPLSAILGWSQMLETGKLDSATVKHGIEVIGRNARAQTQLIEDILDYARIISGKLRLEVARVDLTKVIESAVEVVTPAANAKNIRLQSVLDSNGLVSGDAARLQQVLWNLLLNAIKFTPKGGRVQVQLKRVNSSIEISVIDTGKGINEEFLPYVFERFQQADNSKTRRHSGLGLGLAITRHIVELHGGTIRADSPGENLGATFTVRLPMMIIHQKEVPSIHAKQRISDDEAHNALVNIPRLDGLNTLIVDDNADARDMLTTILTVQGAKIIAAASVFEAVEKLHKQTVDLVISDIEMPDEDGFSLIKKLNAFNKEQKGNIPAIALTAHARASERLQILSAGYKMHLSKPVEPAELITVIANFAGLHNLD